MLQIIMYNNFHTHPYHHNLDIHTAIKSLCWTFNWSKSQTDHPHSIFHCHLGCQIPTSILSFAILRYFHVKHMHVILILSWNKRRDLILLSTAFLRCFKAADMTLWWSLRNERLQLWTFRMLNLKWAEWIMRLRTQILKVEFLRTLFDEKQHLQAE